MKTLRFIVALPFLAAAWLSVVLAMYLGGEKACKAIIRFAYDVQARTPGIEKFRK